MTIPKQRGLVPEHPCPSVQLSHVRPISVFSEHMHSHSLHEPLEEHRRWEEGGEETNHAGVPRTGLLGVLSYAQHQFSIR